MAPHSLTVRRAAPLPARRPRLIRVPPDGCWQVSLGIHWRGFWQDGTPERCKREPTPPRRSREWTLEEEERGGGW
jgi:hypothetical protein